MNTVGEKSGRRDNSRKEYIKLRNNWQNKNEICELLKTSSRNGLQQNATN